MILAAGLGTRLRPLTDELPKPLLPVGDAPAVKMVTQGLRRETKNVVINAFHLADAIEAFAAGEGIAVSRETELLGTAGGVAHAAPLLGAGDVLVWNGDIRATPDLAELRATHTRAGAAATLLVHAAEGDKGNVGLDEEGRIVRLRRETTAPGEVRSADFLGIQIIGAELRAMLPKIGCLVGDFYLPALRRGAHLSVSMYGSPFFFDVGSMATYLYANHRWLDVQGVASWVHPSASVAPGVELERSIVGAGAGVSGSGTLRDVIVWPGASATAPLERAVVTPNRIVRID